VIAAWADRARAGEPRGGPESRFLDRQGLHALETALEVAERSRVPAGPRTGVFAGVGGLEPRWDELTPALRAQRDDGAAAWSRGLSSLHPFFILRHLSNGLHALLASRLGATGEGACFGGATAGAQALLSAARALECGAVEHAVVVAHEGESAAALVLQRQGIARVDVATGIADAEAIARRLARGATVVEGASRGAATAVLQVIEWVEKLAPGEAIVAPSWGAPGLAAAVRVEVA
jgi:hypothetical protein